MIENLPAELYYCLQQTQLSWSSKEDFLDWTQILSMWITIMCLRKEVRGPFMLTNFMKDNDSFSRFHRIRLG